MDGLEQSFRECLQADDVFKSLPPKKLEKAVLKFTDNLEKAITADLLSRAPEMLVRHRKEHDGFAARNFKRWRGAFDLLETIWVMCEEMGGNFNQHFRPEAIRTQNFTFEAMTAVHAKSLLVTAEMICLMKGGFADAALTRWRTLHELSVVAVLLSAHGPKLALRYLAHSHVQEAMDIEPEELEADDEAQQRKAKSDFGLAQFGDDLKKHYGWACELTGKKRPNFEDLENLADKSVGRTIYKRASQHIHSNHRGYDQLLGVGESEGTLLLVGQSDAGMAGPMILGSMTLVETTSVYLMMSPNLDRTIYTKVLLRMSRRLHAKARALENSAAKRIQRRRDKEKRSAAA